MDYKLTEVKSKASEYLQNKKDRNETTYLNYRTSINYFIYYLEDVAEVTVVNEDNIEHLLDSFQNALLNGFLYSVEDTERTVKVKPSGINTHIRRIKSFLNKCFKLKPEIAKLDVAKPKYKSLPKSHVELLANECSNYFSNNEIAVRTETLIRFLFNTAFRIEEALGILTADLYKEDGSYFVKIHEKGKAKGVLTEVAISEKTYNMLMEYIEVKSVPSEFLFSSTGRKTKFSRRQFNNNIKDLASYVDLKYKGYKIDNKEVNITKTVENNSSHFLRHSKAVYLLNIEKEDVVTVQKVLRHKNINSTLIYLNPEEEAINKVRISNDI